MRTSEKTDQLYKAIFKSKTEYQKVLKSSTNPFHKSKYADLGAVLDAIEPALEANNLLIIQGGFDSHTAVTTRLVHADSDQWLEIDMSSPLKSEDPQGVGSAITYLRRYSIMSLFCLRAENDDDGNAGSGKGKTVPMNDKGKPIQSQNKDEKPLPQIKYGPMITDLLKQYNLTKDDAERITGHTTLQGLSNDDLFNAYNLLKRSVDKKK